MIVAICAGGPMHEVALSIEADKWIGVDRGALYLIDNHIIPDIIVGDFDSVTVDEFARVSEAVTHIKQYQAEKDETDTDLALLQAVKYEPAAIYLTGVTGGRLDHFEAALRTLYTFQANYPNIAFKIVNLQNEIQFLTPGKHEMKKSDFTYISFFAYDKTLQNVTLRGVKYKTTNETIEQGTTRFTSNEVISDGSISFEGGICLMISSKD